MGDLHDEIGGRFLRCSPEERHLVVADAWANTLAGDASASSFLELIATTAAERDVEVWGAMVGGHQ